MKNNADYAQAVEARQRLAKTRRPDAIARERERELDEVIRRADVERAGTRLSSGRQNVGRLAKLRSARSRNPERDKPSNEGKTVGLSSENFAREYLSTIGLPDSLDADLLPVSGYLVHKSHIDAKRKNVMNKKSGNIRPDAVYEVGDEDVVGDGLTALGDIEIVLRPSVSERVAYGRGNALTTAHRPVKLNSRNREDVADALLNSDGPNAAKNRREALIGLLSSSINNDFTNVNASRGSKGAVPNSFDKNLPEGSSRDPFEAQILGGFDINDIEQINVPFSKIEAAAQKEDISDVFNTKTVAEKLRAAGPREGEDTPHLGQVRVRVDAPGIVAYADGERLWSLPIDVEVVPAACRVLI
jgi:hypothetical protein